MSSDPTHVAAHCLYVNLPIFATVTCEPAAAPPARTGLQMRAKFDGPWKAYRDGGHRILPSGRRESHPPTPTDPHVSLSTHTARAIRLQATALPYLQCTNSSRCRVRAPCSTHIVFSWGCARVVCTSTSPSASDGGRCRWQSGITAVG